MVLARWQATIVDEEGNVQDGAAVTVRREAVGSPLASLFSDRAGVTPTGNPVTADVDGFASFHVTGGAYQITAVKGGFTRTWRYVAIGLAAESDALIGGMSWRFATATADADPGVGLLRFNNATLASVTQIYLDNLSTLGADVSAWLDTFDDGGSSGDRGIVTVQSVDGAALLVGRVTGSVVNGTGYRKLTVTHLSSAGSFAAGAVVSVFFGRAGLDGDVAGPASATDGHAALFDGATGKVIKSAGFAPQPVDELLTEIAALSTDPNVDSGLFFDDSAGSMQFWTPTAPLSFSGTNLVVASGSESAEGILELATGAEVESSSDTSRAVSPGRLHFHVSAAKCWACINISGGVPSLVGSYNVTSISDFGPGSFGVTIANDFSSANWAPSISASDGNYPSFTGQAGGSINIACHDDDGSFEDPARMGFIGFGDL
jgi:hypothetical protein